MKSKCLELADYKELRAGGGLSAYVQALSRCRGAGFDVYEPHEHRAWEYASALQAASHVTKKGRLAHNIGCGYTAFGVALLFQGWTVDESDPASQVIAVEAPLMQWAWERVPEMSPSFIGEWDLSVRPEKPIVSKYDGVFCISTIEHIPPSSQDQAWENLVAMVAPRGLLFVTTDVCETWKPGHERATYFSMDDVTKRVDWLREKGFQVDADLTYHGDLVDLGRGIPPFTFYRIAATRT